MMKKLDSARPGRSDETNSGADCSQKVYNESIDPMAQIDEALAKKNQEEWQSLLYLSGRW